MGRLPEPPPPHTLVHGRPSEAARSYCGLKPGIGKWSRNRQEVTCRKCQVEIGRRLV